MLAAVDIDCLETALRKGCTGQPVSSLVEPGKYKFPSSWIIAETKLDIIGNWNPPKGPHAWPAKESPIEISVNFPDWNTCGAYVALSDIFMARTSLLEETVTSSRKGSLIQVMDGSICNLEECTIKSNVQECPAIQNLSGSKLFVSKCRFFGGFHPILTSGKYPSRKETSLSVEDSIFCYCTIQAIEVTTASSVLVKRCYFHSCGGQGLALSDVEFSQISECEFDNCGGNNSTSDGALQFRFSSAEVSDTSIKNQKGHGIVMEEGRYEINNIVIKHCDNSGILIDADLSIRYSRISRVHYGLEICHLFKGEIIMEGNKISDCETEVYARDLNREKPKMVGKQHQFLTSGVPSAKLECSPSYKSYRNAIPGYSPISGTPGSGRYVRLNEFDSAYCNTYCVVCGIILGERFVPTKCNSYYLCSLSCRDIFKPFHERGCNQCKN